MSNKCVRCGKTAFHAEQVKHETGVYHSRCFTLWHKEQLANGPKAFGAKYDVKADVQPAYYQATGAAGPRMETGQEYKATIAPGGAGGAPKFCGECGAANSGAKFCGECGFKYFD